MAQWEVLDISSAQSSLDYDSIVNSDIDGVVLLLGSRNYATGTLTADIKLETHYEALQGRTKLGYYWVSQALTEDEIIEEADFCHDLIGDKQCDFPVYIRSDWGNVSHTGRADNLPKDRRTYYILLWIRRMRELGHRVGVYADDTWYRSQLLISYIYEQNASIWVTRCGTYSPSYATSYDGWNYTNEGIKGDNTVLSLSYFYTNVADWEEDTRIDISDLDISLVPSNPIYTGSPITPTPIIEDLTIGEDFLVSYTNNINAGFAICTCDGINDYYGTVNIVFTISPKSIEDMELTLEKKTYEFTGFYIIPLYSIEGLTANIDYTIDCENNLSPGEATIYATARGNYTGVISNTYTIYIDEDMSTKTLLISPERMTYTGRPCCPSVSITGLRKDVDYEVSYIDNINVGNAIVRATGLGRYVGYKEQTFIIDRCHISAVNSYITIDDYTYTGEPIIPTVVVEGLVEGVDYRLEYGENINAGFGTVTLYGLGNFFGDITKYFNIHPKPLDGMTMTVIPEINRYTTDPIKPKVEVEGLVYEEDFLVGYENNIERGTEAKAIAIGRGNYGSEIYKNFTIVKGRMEDYTLHFFPARMVYTGRPLTPTPIIHGLVIGRDYMISYADNIDIGTATGTATGINNFEGSTIATFDIVGQSIENKELILDRYNYIYDGNTKTPNGTIEGLEKDVDYRIEYIDNINAGTAICRAIGIGGYAGTIDVEFTIERKSIADRTVVSIPSTFVYDGTIKTPNVAITGLVRNRDYIVSYNDNVDVGVGTIYCTGINNYKDNAVGTFAITPASIVDEFFAISPTSYTYDGTPKCPEVYTFSTLVEDVDYRVEYENNIDAGIGLVDIIGIGNYANVQQRPFTITPIALDNGDYSINYIPPQYFTPHIEPEVTIDGLVRGVDFNVEYHNNTSVGIGTAEAIGIGNYNKSITKSFYITRTSIRLTTVKLGTPTIYSKYRVDGPLVITFEDYTLVENVDFTTDDWTYEDFGDFTLVTFNGYGIGNFNDGRTYRFRIIPEEPEPGPEYPEYYDADDGTNIDSHGRRKYEDLDFTDDELIDIKTVPMFLKDTVLQYDFGRELKPRYETKLVEGYDFESHYSDNINPGTASIYVLGINAYSGKRDFTFSIIPKNITYGVYFECGEPDVRGHYNINNRKVFYTGERQLVVNEEYEEIISTIFDDTTGIIYNKISIRGIGNFTGNAEAIFNVGSTIEDIQFYTFLIQQYIVYNRDLHRPIPTCDRLVYNRDYKVLGYANNLNAGTATVFLAGIGNYTGTKNVDFIINPAPVTYVKVDIGEIVDEDYDHDHIVVLTADDIELIKGTEVLVTTHDYMIDDLKISDVTVTGIGNYGGTVTKSFYLNDNFLDISKTDVHLLHDTFTYTGSTIEPIVTSRDRIEGIDYTIDYNPDAINVGTYNVTIVGTGNYTGSSKLLPFTINAMSIKQCIPDCGTPDDEGYYNPEFFNMRNPHDVTLIEGTDYTLDKDIYSNYENGTQDCLFTVNGIGNYVGDEIYNYEIADIPDDDKPINPEDAEEIKAKVPVSLINAPVYARSNSVNYDSILNGIYLIYDSNIENNRVRVVKSKHAFNNPCMITGWVSLDDILKINIPFQVNDKVIVTGTVYQYESGEGITEVKDGEVMYITYYNPDAHSPFNFGLSSAKHTAVLWYCESSILKHALLNEKDLNLQT